jgi:soluble lytic murein transglycosylase
MSLICCKLVFRSFLLLSLVSSVSFSMPSTAATLTLEQQRQLYDQAQLWLDDKQVDKYHTIRNKLLNYPLTPYLDYRTMLIDIGDKSPIVVKNFIDAHSLIPFSVTVARSYLNALAAQGKWSLIREFQRTEPSGERYRCHYYTALYRTGEVKLAFAGAEKLWLAGHSISTACDDLFAAWETKRGISDDAVAERVVLAFGESNRPLMSYLAKKIKTKRNTNFVESLMNLSQQPQTAERYLQDKHADLRLGAVMPSILKGLAARDAEKVQSLLVVYPNSKLLSSEERERLTEYVARRLIDTTDLNLAKWRDEIVLKSSNSALIQSRIRVELAEQNYAAVKRWIEHLPDAEKKSPHWQYWLAKSELALGDKAQANTILTGILGQRDFYSVAAAVTLNKPIHYPITNVVYQPKLIRPYQEALYRIGELIARKKIAVAKSEWYWLLKKANDQETAMLAYYAFNQNWHHLSVTAAINAKLWGDITLRFPLAHQWWFNFYGKKHHIDPVLLMSVARQESALDSEAKSAVGARGIMQIMPNTAKHTAKKYQLEYTDADDLFSVGKNIEIGSHYLNELLERYDDNRIFAFASYNAGPSRVDRWRDASGGKRDVFEFIEMIPFNETRGYVQNILMFEVYYRHLLGVNASFLSENELNAKY